MFSPADEHYMARALRLAARGLYTTTPNPRVGCVIVRDGAVVGEGFHERAGALHAEALALREAGARAAGATVYTTLEPCSHQGRTPPCADALIAAGVRRVVAATTDPHPDARYGGERLRAAGVAFETGLLEDEARELNVGFFARLARGLPWVRMKLAATLDGRTGLANGASQWITGEAARRDGHRWRARACAVLTGIGTVRSDDPRLTVRTVDTPRQPLRVLIDSRLEVSPSAHILAGGGTLVFGAVDERERVAALRACGAEVVILTNAAGKTDLGAVMRELARRQMNEIHVEAGSKLNGSLVAAGLVDELVVYLAPRLIGASGQGMFDSPPLTELARTPRLALREVGRIGEDVRVVARFQPPH